MPWVAVQATPKERWAVDIKAFDQLHRISVAVTLTLAESMSDSSFTHLRRTIEAGLRAWYPDELADLGAELGLWPPFEEQTNG